METGSIFFRVIAASIGTGYIIFGRKRERIAPVVAGVVVILLPYFIPGWTINLIATYIVCLVPFFVAI